VRDSTVIIYRELRRSILRAELSPGARLSQAQIAEQFGVSRGPVREALRLLEREGLIEATVNHRPRVARFSIENLEQLYASRIVVEGLCATVSVPRFTEADLVALADSLTQLDRLGETDLDQWEAVHRRFHLALVAPAGGQIGLTIEQFIDHSERYRRVYIERGARAMNVGAAEHAQIVDACVRRDANACGVLLARHLSRTALTVLLAAAPEHEPTLVRAAVRQVTSSAPEVMSVADLL
jgi:DNA-binding GntR family transcriptional regulator